MGAIAYAATIARVLVGSATAVITQIMALPVAYNLLQADSAAIPAGIALAVVAVAALILLINSETTRALGIRGPGRTQDGEGRS